MFFCLFKKKTLTNLATPISAHLKHKICEELTDTHIRTFPFSKIIVKKRDTGVVFDPTSRSKGMCKRVMEILPRDPV